MCGRLVASAVAVLRLVEAEHCLSGCGVVLSSSSLTTEWRPSRTKGRWSVQFASAQRTRSESAIKAFHQTIGLQVVSCYWVVLDVKQVSQGGPQRGGELGAVV